MENESNIRVFDCGLEGNSLLFHKFHGKEREAEIQELPDKEQAEIRVYRHSNRNLAIPAEWLRGSLKAAAYALKWGTGQKGTAKLYVASHVRVSPPMLDLGIKDYELDIRFVPTPDVRARPRCVRPLVNEWKAKCILTCSVKEDDDVHKLLTYAGEHQGIGSNRPNGYGRFKVTSFKEVVK